MLSSSRLQILAMLTTVILGAFTFWYYAIDGVYTNKSIVYREGIDPMNLQLEKTEYKVGETPRFLSSYCKTRESSAYITWKLVYKGQVVGLWEAKKDKPPISTDIGCHPPQPNEAPVPFGTQVLSDWYQPACGLYFVGEIERFYGGGRKENEIIQTEEFCITK